MNWNWLPVELMDKVMGHLPDDPVLCMRASHVCRAWRHGFIHHVRRAVGTRHRFFPEGFGDTAMQAWVGRHMMDEELVLFYVSTRVKVPLKMLGAQPPTCRYTAWLGCFQLEQYPNAVFWPRHLADSYRSVSTSGRFVLVVLKINARTCWYTPRPGSKDPPPTDADAQPFPQYDGITPCSDEQLFEAPLPVLPNSQHMVALFSTTSLKHPRAPLVVSGLPLYGVIPVPHDVHRFSMLSDDQFLAAAAVGRVGVYAINHQQPHLSKRVFLKQSPSRVEYVYVLAGGEVLFIELRRLGGLEMVNINTKEEVGFSHYRLTLHMALRDDYMVVINGIDESHICGLPRRVLPPPRDQLRDKRTKQLPPSLWEYFNHNLDSSVSLPVELAWPLEAPGTFVGERRNPAGGNRVLEIVLCISKEFASGTGFEQYREDFFEGRPRQTVSEAEGEDFRLVPLFSTPFQRDFSWCVCVSPSGRRMAVATSTKIHIVSTLWQSVLVMAMYPIEGLPVNVSSATSDVFYTITPLLAVAGEENVWISEARFIDDATLVVTSGSRVYVYSW